MFTFYYKKNDTVFNCELFGPTKDEIIAALSKIIPFLVNEEYKYLNDKQLRIIDDEIKKLKAIGEIEKVKFSKIYSEDKRQKKWYENYFIIKSLEKFGFSPYPKIDKTIDCKPSDFTDDRIVLVSNTDLWVIVKKHKFKKEEPVIPMYAISSIINSMNNKLFELLSDKYPFPEVNIRTSYKSLIEELKLVPQKDVLKEVYVNAILKSSYQPFITPEMIYKNVSKELQALLKPPKKRRKKK